MLVQADTMEIRLWHVVMKLGDRLKPTHDGNPWPFILWQTEKVVIPDFVVSIGVEAVFTGIPHTTSRFIEQFDSI